LTSKFGPPDPVENGFAGSATASILAASAVFSASSARRFECAPKQIDLVPEAQPVQFMELTLEEGRNQNGVERLSTEIRPGKCCNS
jgi:hypothetical protein